MKKQIIMTVILAAVVTGILLVSFSEARVVPYWSLEFSEGSSASSTGSTLLGADIINDMGVIFKPFNKHTCFILYELKYSGPGFKRLEGRDFSENSMDHMLFAQYQVALSDRYLLRTRLSSMTEFFRSGTNEDWGGGTYDFLRSGVFVEFEAKGYPTVSIEMATLLFPNYSDLLSEYQQGTGAVPDTGEGSKGDQSVTTIGTTYRYRKHKVSVKQGINNYIKQTVVQPDGTYGSTKQADNILTVKYDTLQRLGSFLFVEPEISLKTKTSNQNYMHYEVPGTTDVSKIHYVGNYYAYTQTSVGCRFDLYLTRSKSFFLKPEIIMKNYADRPALDAGNQLTNEKQNTTITVMTVGYSVKWNKVSRWTLLYSNHSQSSNVKYEKYVPYTYTGTYIGMKFAFTY